MVSETVHYKRGVSQQFSMPSFKIDFSEWKEEDVSICSNKVELITRSHITKMQLNGILCTFSTTAEL